MLLDKHKNITTNVLLHSHLKQDAKLHNYHSMQQAYVQLCRVCLHMYMLTHLNHLIGMNSTSNGTSIFYTLWLYVPQVFATYVIKTYRNIHTSMTSYMYK